MSSKSANRAYTTHNELKIVRGGAGYFKAIEAIADGAKYSLHLQTYIFDEDETGNTVAAALVRAAKRGVLVYVLLDGYASQNISEGLIGRLRAAGVHFAFFEPMMKSRHFYFGRRLHHKIVVADAAVCLVAGINVSNRYNDVGDTAAWLDWAIMARGDVARQINDVCVKTWNRSVFRKKCIATKNPVPDPMPTGQCMVRVRINDWVYKKTQITRSYREMFYTARTEVMLMTSYFWPPRKLLVAMARASARGVNIKLILTATADVPFAKYAERYLYKWLFRHNIEVYEYQHNILHGKIAVCDGEFITVGSYNVNNISAFASVELNLDVKNAVIATEVAEKFKSIITEECVQIDRHNFWSSNSLWNRFLFYFSYRLIHMAFFLFTFYFIQRRPKN